MALNGTVNPNCANRSNPYHQCSQACAQKTTKGHANKKTTNSGGYVAGGHTADGEAGGKKTNQVRRTHGHTAGGCPKASNPYHKCDRNCNNNTLPISGAAPPPADSNFKRPAGSRPKPPVLDLDSVPASKPGAIYLSSAPSPIISHDHNKNVEEPKTDIEHTHSGHDIPDVMLVNHKDQVKDDAEHLITKPIEINEEEEEEDKVIASHELAVGSRHFSFSGSNGGHSCEEETESVISESRVPVGKYNVKESFASILRSILDKYGDIGESCHLESVAMRSYYIECVCFIVQELQSNDSVMQLTNSKIDELFAILKDVESAHLRVAWLRIALDEIAENIEVITHHRDVEAEKANSAREMESLREQLESEMKTLALKEQEIADIKNRIPDIRDRLSELELKSSELDQTTLSIKSKVDNLNSKSSLGEL